MNEYQQAPRDFQNAVETIDAIWERQIAQFCASNVEFPLMIQNTRERFRDKNIQTKIRGGSPGTLATLEKKDENSDMKENRSASRSPAQNHTTKMKCVCVREHRYLECYYLNYQICPQRWRPRQAIGKNMISYSAR